MIKDLHDNEIPLDPKIQAEIDAAVANVDRTAPLPWMLVADDDRDIQAVKRIVFLVSVSRWTHSPLVPVGFALSVFLNVPTPISTAMGWLLAIYVTLLAIEYRLHLSQHEEMCCMDTRPPQVGTFYLGAMFGRKTAVASMAANALLSIWPVVVFLVAYGPREGPNQWIFITVVSALVYCFQGAASLGCFTLGSDPRAAEFFLWLWGMRRRDVESIHESMTSFRVLTLDERVKRLLAVVETQYSLLPEFRRKVWDYASAIQCDAQRVKDEHVYNTVSHIWHMWPKSEGV
jgi:hypothetical protein